VPGGFILGQVEFRDEVAPLVGVVYDFFDGLLLRILISFFFFYFPGHNQLLEVILLLPIRIYWLYLHFNILALALFHSGFRSGRWGFASPGV